MIRARPPNPPIPTTPHKTHPPKKKHQQVDGIADIELDDALTRNAEKGTGVACVVNSYAGATRKGYAPYNLSKKNQDSIIM